jgi:phosphatidylinositol alpha-1,6-mannosyltransferase
MTAAPRSVLLTPNLRGADGVSCLSRQIAGALEAPVAVVSLHDAADRTPDLRSAGGSRLRLVADAMALGLRCDRTTTIVCSHVHLAPVARLMAWRGAQVTYVLCGIEAWAPLRLAERAALATGRLVAISAHTAREFKAANPWFADAAVEVCHPGLPPRSDDPSGEPVDLAALLVGRMSASEAYKGHEPLLRLWPRVLRRHPRAELWMVGDGDDRPRLETLALHLGIGGAVTFTGRVSDAELDRRYRRCQFFVMPSRDEGFGLVFVEAMRAGKACIGAPGAAAEIIQHGVTGLIADPTRGDELHDAIVRLLADPAQCAEFGRAGAARFHAEFTAARFAARFAARMPPGRPVAAALDRR